MSDLPWGALQIGYDMRDRTGMVVLPHGADIDLKAITDYYDDATECCIRSVVVYVYGDINRTVKADRTEGGEWKTLDGLIE